MRALRMDEGVRLVDDQPEPTRGPGEALIRMRAAGVCDTDLQLARGYMGYRGVLGHEMVGEVIEAGDASWLGRRIVSDINAGCGRCDDCVKRDGHHCTERTVLGIVGRDGAFAELLTMPERCLVPVPDSVDDDRAVFAEPLAAALHVLDVVQRGEPVTVLGDGKLGQLIARALLGSDITVRMIGHHGAKLAIAKEAGADVALDADVDPNDKARTVVEATGSASGLARALSLTQPRGTLVLKTTVAGTTDVDLSPIVIDELNVVGSRCGNLRDAVAALERVDPTALIDARYTLADAERALEHAARKGVMKVLITPSGIQ